MNFRRNDELDLCWYFRFRGFCINAECTWRHEIPAARRAWKQRRPKMTIEYEENPRKSYSVRLLSDVGIEDNHGLVHYHVRGKVDDAIRKMSKMRTKVEALRREQSSPMSVPSLISPVASPMKNSYKGSVFCFC